MPASPRSTTVAVQPRRPRIELSRCPVKNVWLAHFVNDTLIEDLFGTECIPTPFTAEAPADTVLREIASLNPEAEVVLATV